MALVPRRRSKFLRSLEEDIQIRRGRPQGRPGYTYPIGTTTIKAIIRPARHTTIPETIVSLDFHYICNITPVRTEIRLNDEVVRQSSGQILIVTFIDVVDKILQLKLKDVNRTLE